MKSIRIFYAYLILVFSLNSFSDSFLNNSFNNHGVIGTINMPSARFYDESVFGFSIYNGNPDQKLTMTSYPYDWLEASFFYTNIKDKNYCNYSDSFCDQGYKDKGFNFKLRLKEEGLLPAIAIGINDIAGTGFYSSEYIVASYGINNIDFSMGIGWGNLSGSDQAFKNPLIQLHSSFEDRPTKFNDEGGQFEPSRYFSGKKASPFFGVNYILNNKTKFKLEFDSTLTPGMVGYDLPKSNYSYGIDFSINDNFTVGISSERGNQSSLKFIYKVNTKKSKKSHEFKKAKYKENDNSLTKLKKNLERNGIGVNKIVESDNFIGLELTQFTHPGIETVEEIIEFSVQDSGISKKVDTDLRIASLRAVSGIDYTHNPKLIYKKNKESNFNTKTFLNVKPYLASREDFFKGALLIENNFEYIFGEKLIFSSNIKYSLANNFNDLNIPPNNTFPEQVRSDVKDYLRNIDSGIIIGRAQFDYYHTLKENNHLMFTAGILEEMFNGFGFEYLYFNANKSHAFGFEIFNVKKRDYRMKFGMQDYQNIYSSVNYYYRNYEVIPFDAKISYGEYLAGDKGITIDLSRSFLNGTKLGIFATFTDVSTKDFGEGSFDKGIYFNIPIYGSFINYSWRPLTKDPGAKLIRKHTLHDLLIRFRPYNY